MRCRYPKWMREKQVSSGKHLVTLAWDDGKVGSETMLLVGDKGLRAVQRLIERLSLPPATEKEKP